MAEGLPAPKKNNHNKKVVFKKKWEIPKIRQMGLTFINPFLKFPLFIHVIMKDDEWSLLLLPQCILILILNECK